MSEKQSHLKLIISNEFPFPQEEQISSHKWWSTLSWHSKTQIFVFIVLLGSLVSAITFHFLKNWYIATGMWMLSFCCMFLIWGLEYCLRMDTDHIKNY